MTNEEKAVGISLQVRDLCIEKGVTKDNAETASLLVQQAALQMAQWKDEEFDKLIAEFIKRANDIVKAYISTEDSETNSSIERGFFSKEDFDNIITK